MFDLESSKYVNSTKNRKSEILSLKLPSEEIGPASKTQVTQSRRIGQVDTVVMIKPK